jgi:hypothetical protein
MSFPAENRLAPDHHDLRIVEQAGNDRSMQRQAALLGEAKRVHALI